MKSTGMYRIFGIQKLILFVDQVYSVIFQVSIDTIIYLNP